MHAVPQDELALPDDIRRLADEYRTAAHLLLDLGRPGNALSRAPYRLAAIHAIELYLSAFLLHKGHAPSKIRGLQHRLKDRADLSIVSGLQLRKRTAAHLVALDDNQEYLVTRYRPQMMAKVTQVNRLRATLDEVADKVSRAIRR
jgi:hypothetical protein